MPNPFLNPESFNPQLVNKVSAAYERNLGLNGSGNGAFAGEVGVQSLADTVKASTAEARANGSAGLVGFDQLTNPDTRQAFETSFTATEQLFDRINLTTPTAEQCIDAGVDLIALATAYERMKTEGLQPELVLSPKLDRGAWHALYQQLEGVLLLINNNILASNDINNRWNTLATLPDDVPTIVTSSSSVDIDKSPPWSLRLVPGTSAPATTRVKHSYNQAVHPTFSEYLTLQAIRLQANQEPLDSLSYTWLNGSFVNSDDCVCALFGRWISSEKEIMIDLEYADSLFDRMGARLPIWA